MLLIKNEIVVQAIKKMIKMNSNLSIEDKLAGSPLEPQRKVMIDKSEVLIPDFESLDKLSYSDFASAIRPFNQSVIEQVRESVSSIENNPYGVTWIIPGSHAREENILSPIELILLHEDNFKISEQYLEESKYLLDQQFPGKMYPYQITMSTKINDQTKMPRFNTSRRATASPFPVLLEATSIYNPSMLLEKTRISILKKLKTPLGSKSLRKQNRMLNEAFGITKIGSGTYRKQSVLQVDYESGISLFSEKNEIGARQESFKRGPLRVVQYRLSRDFIARTRDPQKSDIPLSEMPANISSRISYLQENGFTSLSNLGAESLADHYQFFLHQTYLSAVNYFNNGSSMTEFDKVEVKQRRQELLDLTSKPLI